MFYVLTNSSVVCVQTLCTRQTGIFAEQVGAATMEMWFLTTKSQEKHGRKAK